MMEKSDDSSTAAADHDISHSPPEDSDLIAAKQNQSRSAQSDKDYTSATIQARLESYYKHAWGIAELFCDQSFTVNTDNNVDEEVGGFGCQKKNRNQLDATLRLRVWIQWQCCRVRNTRTFTLQSSLLLTRVVSWTVCSERRGRGWNNNGER